MRAPFVSLIAAAVALSGCTTLPARKSSGTYTRTYSDSRASIWRRILRESSREAMFIRRADTASGIIAADWEQPASIQTYIFQETISNWAWCGSAGLLGRTLSQRAELNYLVRDERDGRTTVTLNGRFRVLRADTPLQQPHWVECASTGVLEGKLIDNLYYEKVG